MVALPSKCVVSKWLKDVRETPPTCGDEQHDAWLPKRCSRLLTAQADDAWWTIAESRGSHSQSIAEWKCPSIHFQSIHSSSPTLQPADQWSNERPCFEWIDTPFSDIIVGIRDKGQVMGGPYVARACSALTQLICPSPLIIWSLQRRKRDERMIFFPPTFNNTWKCLQKLFFIGPNYLVEKEEILVFPLFLLIFNETERDWFRGSPHTHFYRFNIRNIIDSWRNDANRIKFINVLSSGFL